MAPAHKSQVLNTCKCQHTTLIIIICIIYIICYAIIITFEVLFSKCSLTTNEQTSFKMLDNDKYTSLIACFKGKLISTNLTPYWRHYTQHTTLSITITNAILSINCTNSGNCWVSLCRASLCRVSLCWASPHLITYRIVLKSLVQRQTH